MSVEVESYLSSLGIAPEDSFQHFGVLGMKWGVRKAKLPKIQRAKVALTAEQKATRKKVFIGMGVAAAVLATAAIAYATTKEIKTHGQITNLVTMGSKRMSDFKNTPIADRLVAKGSEFVRASHLKDGAWPNELRTYVMEGANHEDVEHYGGKAFRFLANRDVKIAGLDTQFNLLTSDNTKAFRSAAAKDVAKYSFFGRQYINKLSAEDFAKLAFARIGTTAWDHSESGAALPKLFSDFLKKYGYAAVNDLNIQHIPARVLLDKTAFDLI